MGPREGVGDGGAEFALGDELGGLFDVGAGGSDGAGYLEFAEDDFREREFGFGAGDFAEEDETAVGGQGAEGLGEEGGADGVEGNVGAAVFGEGEDDFREVEVAGGDDVGRAEGFEGGGLGFVGGDGEDSGAAEVGELDEVGAEAAGSAGDQNCFVRFELGFFDGFEGDGDGAGEERCLGKGDFFGDFDQGVFPDGQELGHAALHAVTDGLSLGAESFEILGAELAASAGVGEEGDDVVAGVECGDVGADIYDDAGDFVAGDEGWSDVASEGAADDEEVMAAEATSFDLDEDLGVGQLGCGEVCDGESGVWAGLVEEEGFHGVGAMESRPSKSSSVEGKGSPPPPDSSSRGLLRRKKGMGWATTRVALIGERG